MKSFTSLSIKACSALSAFTAFSAHAHAGHGDHDDWVDAVMHWFSSWDHLLVLVVLAGVVAYGVKHARVVRSARRSGRDHQ